MVDFTERSRREAKLLTIQQQIADGTYDSDEKLEAALEKMLEQQGLLDGTPPRQPR